MPANTAKFNLATVGLTEASNVVYAFCDISQLTSQLGVLLDYSDPEQYLVVLSRIGGAMINTVPELRSCIEDGQMK